MFDRQSFILAELGLHEANQRKPRAIIAAVYQTPVCGDSRRGNGTRRSDRLAQICSSQVGDDLLEGAEVENFALDYWAAYGPAKLLAVEVGERLAIRRVSRQRLEPLKMIQAAVDVVCPGFRNHVYDPACRASEFRAGAGGDHLEFLDCIQRDVDGSPLAAGLLTKEAVVVVTPIQADVVEDSSLA